MRLLAWLGRLLVRLALAVRIAARALVGARHAHHERAVTERRAELEQAREDDPTERRVVATRRRENVVAGLLLACAACAAAFVVLFLTGDPVQLEGLTLGGACAFLAAALGFAGKRLVPQITAAEPRPQLEHPDDERAVEADVAAGLEGISRRKLLGAAGLAAGGTLAAAVAVPVASLGPAVGDAPSETPWRRGRAIVDERGRPILADGIANGSFVTAFPQGADPRELGSPIVVVRVDPRRLELPAGREGWAPEGLLAYSRICTHAGCAVALFRSPKFEAGGQHEPALQCPCHYSTFAVRRGAKVVFGPAKRPLPQLPLVIGDGRQLLAGGPLSGPVGPSWWGVQKQ